MIITWRFADAVLIIDSLRDLASASKNRQELFKNIKKYSLQQKKSSCNVETLTMERSVS